MEAKTISPKEVVVQMPKETLPHVTASVATSATSITISITASAAYRPTDCTEQSETISASFTDI
ncbi:uncharacterized protein HMPREF1120_03786 [Exophiala dermatitidis NIH/UT8656]|uniref:Uncharacterized protein n=1 Tax=Exophiala dermatitidis (strain ATCC 34100 / CBS 525.76 / NIH/UT8656) TaxID=858893 RepID=H6BU79_EXODN|nr:uncharacterized protein HMPREF1120_03786 [Exophiala dermatitidis NIH/UT8656]EHY55656.1 hypothetical protein HMPREF1120_03786 [Exophiala dermatitidis NIH/UT8656]